MQTGADDNAYPSLISQRPARNPVLALVTFSDLEFPDHFFPRAIPFVFEAGNAVIRDAVRAWAAASGQDVVAALIVEEWLQQGGEGIKFPDDIGRQRQKLFRFLDKKYTDRECDRFLWNDLQPVKKGVDGLVKVPLGEYQRAALYSFTYNVGLNAFSKSTMLKKLNAGDVEGACDEMRRWVYAGGMKWKGLQNRREMERSMCIAEKACGIT